MDEYQQKRSLPKIERDRSKIKSQKRMLGKGQHSGQGLDQVNNSDQGQGLRLDQGHCLCLDQGQVNNSDQGQGLCPDQGHGLCLDQGQVNNSDQGQVYV